jgi:hypothetical protein
MNSRLLIFEGPDMSGKTNISQEFCRRTTFQYFKNRSERDSFGADPDYFRNCLKYGVPYQLSLLEQVTCDIVFDRHYPTEWVYSRAFERETYSDVLDHVDQRFADLNAAIVICRRDNYVGVYDDTFPEKIDPLRLEQLNDLYRQFMAWTRCDVYVLDVTKRDIDRHVNEIYDFVNRVWKV